MDLYFERHDGQAVTCDDFRAALADANGAQELLGEQFERWYTQAGTPTVKASGAYDAAKKTYTLTLSQSTPATPGQPTKLPFVIPVATGLLLKDGTPLGDTRVLQLREEEQSFVFDNVPSEPVPSLLRGFSAPVRLSVERSDEDLLLLASSDPDSFNRWDAAQQLASRVLLGLAAQDGKGEVGKPLLEAYRATLTDESLDPSLAAYSLSLPDYATLSQEMSPVDPDALCAALKTAKDAIAAALRPELLAAYERLAPKEGETFNIEPATVGKRRLRNTCLAYLCKGGAAEDQERALAQFRTATCMTDSLAAAAALAPHVGKARDEALAAFYERAAANKEELVINKWFAIQAAAESPAALENVQALLKHPAYNDNPNRVRSVISTFAGANPAAFHKADGSGYDFVAAQVIALDKKNPQLAARLASAFGQWRRYTPERSAQMKAALEKIKATEGLSKDTFEIASRSLA